MTDARLTQIVRTTLGVVEPGARATQIVRLVVGALAPPTRTTQLVRLTIGTVLAPPRITQLVRLVVAAGEPCATQRQQLWRLTRRDGVILRFTSLDVDFLWGNELFETCGSLNPSASEQASTLGAVGNIELEGVIRSDHVTEADLYAGLYDDAFVEIWDVGWGTSSSDPPRRIAAGWCGNLSHGDNAFRMDVLGPGSRIDQQAITQPVTPKCRWIFGDPATCGVDIESMKLTGDVVFATNREAFMANLSASDPGGILYDSGRVRWNTGRNTGQICEVKTVDFVTGIILLWALPGFLPDPGDTFDLLPGCLQDKPTCRDVYDNFLNFGGFPDLPGDDDISKTPVKKVGN